MSVIETVIIKKDLEMFFDGCPKCNHKWNPDLVIKSGTKLELKYGFAGKYICIVYGRDGEVGCKPIISNVNTIWKQVLKLSK